MQFTYNENSKQDTLNIESESYKYLFKVRRHKLNEIINFRNLIDNNIYEYRVIEINRREAILKLINNYKKSIEPKKFLEIAWCIIDLKSIEKTLPSLNEIGVSKISFIYCDRSQRNFKLNMDRLKTILINSNQQCGRSSFIEFEIFNSLDEFILKRDNIIVLDFCKNIIDSKDNNIETILIGNEGGFSESERDKISKFKKIGFDTNLILRSESAVMAVASKLLI